MCWAKYSDTISEVFVVLSAVAATPEGAVGDICEVKIEIENWTFAQRKVSFQE